jgi:hypothetical protein
MPLSAHPKLPIVKDVASEHGQRLVAQAFVGGVAFFLALFILTALIRTVFEGEMPSRIGAGPLGMEWPSEDISKLREIVTRLQKRNKEAIDLSKEAIRRIRELEQRE